MISVSQQIREHIKLGQFQQAYLLGREALRDQEQTSSVLSALCELTAKIRFECMSMAAKKTDYGHECLALEKLLREASELTNQDMYGNFKK
ncbi:MAG TPA: hypothetical protein VFH31_21640 [Pyrinomonadaceae bacterium]|nr:hypothetical protein [Pyrinomonadaceae bacterium]